MQFKGVSANAGQASGALCIVTDEKQFDQCDENSIVLLVKVKPNAALAKKVKAILSVHGGITSHAAIAARENNKPAIVGLPETMVAQVQEGSMVQVDAAAGTVEIL